MDLIGSNSSPLPDHPPSELASDSYLTDKIMSSEPVPNIELKSSNEKLENCKSDEHTFMEHKSSKNISSHAVEYMDIDETGNKLDTVTPKTTLTKINNVHNKSENKSLSSHIIDNFSSTEDDNDDEDGTMLVNDPARPWSLKNRIYSCHQCDMTTASAKTYVHHLNNVHNIKFEFYECDLCDYATVYKQKLTLHQKRHFLPNGDDHHNSSFYSGDKITLNHMNGRDSILSNSLDNSTKNDLFIKDEMDDFEDEDDRDMPSRDQTSTSLVVTSDNIDEVLDDDKKRKKKTRQEVDPGKYFETIDGGGTKYACSQCGNIYKWRKSLNKHWKEKHTLEDLVEAASPPGMLEVLKTGKYTQLGARRIYENVFLDTIKTTKNDDNSFPATLIGSNHSSSPARFQDISNVNPTTTSRLTPPGLPLIPNIIGPFVTSSSQPVFPGMLMMSPYSIHSNGNDTFEKDVLDLSIENKPTSLISPILAQYTPSLDHSLSFDQDEPLDFSKSAGKATPEVLDVNSRKPIYSIDQIVPRQQHCSKCGYPCSCDAEIPNHTNSHLNKRIFICFECKLQINTMEELNNHFIKFHFQKLSDHKEAIKKIPHGLQQAYHVLNMNIQDICELGNQDLGTMEGKSLKCKKCNFEAKWPAELQKHAVSHSEERPYICMVCGSTYKWKWDLVKHFQKSHPNLPNPYRRNDKRDTTDESSEDEGDPSPKRPKLYAGNDSQYSRDDALSAGQVDHTLISNQPNIDSESIMGKSLSFFNMFPFASHTEVSPAAALSQEVDRHKTASKTSQGTTRTRHNSVRGRTGSSNAKINTTSCSSPEGINSEDILYKCATCDYYARWPSEVVQHMKNHSDTKPYLCPRCEYRSKWKWDVVKHLKRCGGGTIKDVIDTTKLLKVDICGNKGSQISAVSNGFVRKYGRVKKMALPRPSSYVVPSTDENLRSSCELTVTSNDHIRPNTGTLIQDLSSSNLDKVDSYASDNAHDNYTSHPSGVPFVNFSSHTPSLGRVSSAIGNNTPSNSPSSSLVSSSVAQTTSSRQNSSGTVWNCPHCSFTTQSQAELKRHSDLHSDDKPFKCDMCQYATRWACDLKKHRKGYNHYPKITNSTTTVAETTEKPVPRFKCSQCVIYFETFDSLLQHRQAEHTSHESEQSTTAVKVKSEIDIARIKHPRKRMKNFECPKCPFVCKGRQTIAGHLNEHDQFELIDTKCFFCSAQFENKELLLDHIVTHSTFTPQEWETFFMITEDEQCVLKAAKPSDYKKNNDKSQNDETKKRKISHEVKDHSNKAADLDLTEARIKKILDEVPKQMKVSEHVAYSTQFKCEWCMVEFVNLTALYKHASQAHPKQLKEQDVDVNEAAESHIPKSHSDQSVSVNKSLKEVTDVLKQQVNEKRSNKVKKMYLDYFMPRMEGKQRKKLNVEKDLDDDSSCDKYSILASNFSTFQNNYQLNGNKQQSQCWFCDFTVDQMNLLYQHMKISHTRKWKAASQDPKYAPYVHRINRAFARNGIHGNNIDSPSDNIQNAMDLSLERKTPLSLTMDGIIYLTRRQSTWNEIPVNIAPVGTSLNFLCPYCDFQHALIDNTCNHVMQNHHPIPKFTCKICQYSVDNIHKMSDHSTKEHSPVERIVEVIDFKEINFDELQMAHLKERVTPSKDDLDLKSVTRKTMCCPFCPYKTLFTDHMKTHVSGHSRQANYQCHICDYSSDYSTAIDDHVRVHDADYTLDNRSLNVTKSEVAVRNEFTNVNAPESKVTATALSAMKHIEDGSKDDEEADRSKVGKRIRYRCSVCPYHSTCRSNMVKHKRQHNNNKKYKCCRCSYSAARAVLLKNHIDSHETPVVSERQYHDIFCDPNNPNNNFENDDNESGEAEVENVDDDDDADSDDINEIDARAIADLEAKDILKAESALKASIPLEGRDNIDKLLHKQRCPHCPFSSMSVPELCKHLSYHVAQEKYKCNHCSYSIDRLNLLNQHRRLHVDEAGYISNPPTTNLLNASFILQQNSKSPETSDWIVPAEEGNNQLSISHLTCKLCPFKTCKRKFFKVHCANHGSRKFYICDFCDWSTDHIGNLHHHRRVHENEPLYSAKPEDNAFLNQEFDGIAAGEFEAKFMEFKNVCKQGNEDQRGGCVSPPFKLAVVRKTHHCQQCPFKTSSKNSYYAHKNMHNSGLDFACTKCSYASMNRGLLQQHLHLHTSSVEDTSPVLKDNLNSHEVHDLEATNETVSLVNSNLKLPVIVNQYDSFVHSDLECQRCPFTTSSQSLLNDHIKGHVSHESLKCPYCDFSAPSRQTMFPHIQIHFAGTGIELEALEHIMEEHSRRMCNNSYNFNNNNHEKLKSLSPKVEKITEEEAEVKIKRIYVCQYCEREFEVKQLMIQHEKQHLIGNQ